MRYNCPKCFRIVDSRVEHFIPCGVPFDECPVKMAASIDHKASMYLTTTILSLMVGVFVALAWAGVFEPNCPAAPKIADRYQR